MLQSYRASDYGSNIPNLQRHLTLNAEGNFAMYTWSEAEGAWLILVWRALSDACQVRGVCGNGICTLPNVSDLSQYVCSCPQGFLRNDSQDWSQGCFRQIPLTSCNSAPNSNLTVQMHSFNNVNYLGPASFIDQVASAADCGTLCLQNCSCVCASYGSDRVCWIHSDMQYGAQSDPNQTYVFLLKLAQKSSAILEGLPAAKGHHHPRLLPPAAIAGTCFAALAATALFILLAWHLFTQRERSRLEELWSLRQSTGLPIKFSYKELEHATDNFNSKHRLGSGGFGTVFKGVLAGDKSTVAVKKLHSSLEGGQEAQFQAEVSTIGSIHNVNIVRLRGFCCEGSHRILVYEYMPKGSLDRYLLDKSRSVGDIGEALDWKTRFNIALGVAKGIAYCHEQCRSRIIHCDIKPENVLLEHDYNPKVSDFGLAKLVSKSQTRVITAIRGTRGYVGPEWVANLPVTMKADVYSYGMLLLEVIGWRRNLDLCVDSLDSFTIHIGPSTT
ncbi:hypothetical protein L7F22_024191 [Adiantum nelumboides]|nr:hypothetical protein [Adiantum nelumboides]